MKNKNLIISAGFILIIIVSLIFPVKYHYVPKKVPAIPSYTPYDTAIQKLAKSIRQQAKQYRCKRYVLPVQHVKALSLSLLQVFPSLKEDVNIALASYKKWKLRASEEEIASMKARYDKMNHVWKFNGNQLGQNITTQRKVVFGTMYSAEAELIRIPNNKSNGNDLKLIVTVNNQRKLTLAFKTEVNFVNPRTLQQWEKERQKKRAKLAQLKKRSDIGLKLALLFAGLWVLFLLFLLLKYFYQKHRKKNRMNFFLQEINNVEGLISKGDFVAAYQTIEKYLKLFPDDSKVIALKERLLDFTNNDPKKAQVAYVEAKKLQLRFQPDNDNLSQPVFLTEAEKKRLAPYLAYHPDLKETYLSLVAHEEEVHNREAFVSALNVARKMLSSGKLYEAIKRHQEIKNQFPGMENDEQLQNLHREILQIEETAKKNWNPVHENLIKGNTATVTRQLKELLNLFPDMPEALALRENMNNAGGFTRFRLTPPHQGKPVTVLCGNRFTLGRKDEDIYPDINFDDKRVSRKHAVLFVNGQQIVVEDVGSTGGTFVNGGKTNRKNLINGDLLTLGKIINLKITLFFTEDKAPGGLVLSGAEGDFLLLFSHARLGFREGNLFAGGDDFSLRFDNENECVLWIAGKEAFFLVPGKELTIHHLKYVVEEIQ